MEFSNGSSHFRSPPHCCLNIYQSKAGLEESFRESPRGHCHSLGMEGVKLAATSSPGTNDLQAIILGEYCTSENLCGEKIIL